MTQPLIHSRDPYRGAAPAESERTRRLRMLGLNDSSADEAFDRFAHLAASMTRAPIAMVNFVNDERQMFRGLFVPPAGATVADQGDSGASWADRGVVFELPTREMPLSHGFCPHVVAQRAPLALDDVFAYPRFKGNPVVNELGVRAYLGAPLVDDTRTVIGTVCVLDTAPRQWGRARLRDMQQLAEALLSEIRLRGSLISQQQELFGIFDGTPFPIMVTDGPDHVVAYANDEHDAVFGRAERGMPGMSVLPQLAGFGLFNAIDEAVRTGRRTVLREVRIASGSGLPGRWFTFTCTPLRSSAAGNGALVVAADVTAQSRTEQELGQLAAALMDRLQQSGRQHG